MTIGKLTKVKLRDVWPHEALDFTRWLTENIDVLNDATGLQLSNALRERPAGSFNVDIVAEDENGDVVVIENQLEASNHDHLGKLLTYLTAFEAKTAAWIVANPRIEHVNAIAWLNQSSSAAFYLLKVEAVRIGDSAPAPLLTQIVGPNEESRKTRHIKEEIKEEFDDRKSVRKRFWVGLLQVANQKTQLHASRSPNGDSWLAAGGGRAGISFTYSIRQHEVQVEVYIDRGAEREEENERILDAFLRHKDDIEAKVGAPLEWQRLDTRRGCRVRLVSDKGGYRDADLWPELFEWMASHMAKLEVAFRPLISRLDRDLSDAAAENMAVGVSGIAPLKSAFTASVE